MPKSRKVQYRDPVTGNMRWVDEDQLIGQNDHSLKGTPKGPMAEETKSKIAAGVRKHLEKNPRVQSEETKERIRQANRGKEVSQETRDKLSQRATEQWAKKKVKGYTVSVRTRQKLSQANKGKSKSAEHRAKISAALRARHQQKRAAPK